MIDFELTPQRTEELHNVLASYLDIFDISGRAMGQATDVTHRVNTGDALPIRRPYRVSAPERQIIQSEHDKILAKNIIDPSFSPWASAIVLVKKKDGTWRFCVDYRHLNRTAKTDAPSATN